jgi:hypothetical protein
LAGRSDQQVRWLDVAMNDAHRVCSGKAIGNLCRQFQQLADIGDWPDRCALDELHHQVVRADVVQLADVRVVQGRDCASLTLEALRELALETLIATRRSRRVSRAA